MHYLPTRPRPVEDHSRLHRRSAMPGSQVIDDQLAAAWTSSWTYRRRVRFEACLSSSSSEIDCSFSQTPRSQRTSRFGVAQLVEAGEAAGVIDIPDAPIGAR